MLNNGMKKCIPRTENTNELAALYSGAKVFVNLTYIDNFPTVNVEALACGTPVITYDTGGSPESIDPHSGIVVEKGNIKEIKNAIMTIFTNGDLICKDYCRTRAVEKYSANKQYSQYITLYQELLNNN